MRVPINERITASGLYETGGHVATGVSAGIQFKPVALPSSLASRFFRNQELRTRTAERASRRTLLSPERAADLFRLSCYQEVCIIINKGIGLSRYAIN